MGRRANTKEDVWKYIDQSDGPDACHPWRMFKGYNNYGQFRVKFKHYLAHRLVYELVFGPIPDDLIVRHSCHNGACCNPRHLQLGTHADNSNDMIEAGRSLKGERHPAAKLNNKKVIVIYALKDSGRSTRDVGDEFNIHQSIISDIWTQKLWSHVTQQLS